MPQQQLASDENPVAKVLNPNGAHSLVLVCEHASNFIPAKFQNLGLSNEALARHIAWDPGALQTATEISKRLDAKLVQSCISRLVYDCNRPPEARSAMPEKSESTEIPGNQNLSDTERTERVSDYYIPFENLVSQTLDQNGNQSAMVTIHSFTPRYLGKTRDVEIGILHDEDTRLADAILAIASGYKIERNEPYGPEDGVTHTLKRHALPRGILNVMIEIRNDLISTPEQCMKMGETVAHWLSNALEQLSVFPDREMAR